MTRRRAAAWFLSIPLMVAGSQVAHVFAYRLVYPQAQVRLRDLLATGHSYMLGRLGFLPLVLGVVLGLELVAVGWAIVGAVRERWARPVPAWAFALLPIAGFTTQEFLERWLMGGGVPWWMVEQPTFRVGIALQLPFALLAYLAARLLLRVGHTIGSTLVDRSLPALVGLSPPARPLARVFSRPSALQRGWSVRGPPLPSV